eukprot:scaffold14401_cov58-Cyclotella_meneghiniana.AAC.18
MVCWYKIDGIIIWMNRPTLKEASKVCVDQQKFFCGRKQGSKEAQVWIELSDAADCLAFKKSKLYKQLQKGLLAEDLVLVLFGDNSYINSMMFMSTPYDHNTTGGSKDNYNFYYSQLRIKIECEFGMLVQRVTPMLQIEHLRDCIYRAKERGDMKTVVWIRQILRTEKLCRLWSGVHKSTRPRRGGAPTSIKVKHPTGDVQYDTRADVETQAAR